MDIEQLKQIIELLKQEQLTEITVAEGEDQITVRQDVSRSTPPTSTSTELGTEVPVAEQTGTSPLEDERTFTAPLVGTFFLHPSPDEDPFVQQGDVVEKGQTLCIIEAMKVMNEIHAEQPGQIEEILVSDGETVEYGQPLFIFEKS